MNDKSRKFSSANLSKIQPIRKVGILNLSTRYKISDFFLKTLYWAYVCDLTFYPEFRKNTVGWIS